MNKYLLQLLSEINMLVIPGLGALNIVNKSTGEIMFMNYMKHDDGTLAKHIAEKEGLELNDAKNLVSKFVREVQAQLDKGDSYDMFQFGSFNKVAGDIDFVQWKTEEIKAIEENSVEEVPLAPIPIVEEVVIESPVETIVEKIELETISEIKPIESIVIHEEVPPIQEVKEEIENIEAAIPLEISNEVTEPETISTPIIENSLDEILNEKATIEPIVEDSNSIEPVLETQKNETPVQIEEIPEQILIKSTVEQVSKPIEEEIIPLVKVVKPAVKEKPKADVKTPKPEKEKKSKKSVLTYVLWGFVVLVLGAGTFVAVKFDSLKNDFPILAQWTGDNSSSDSTAVPANEDKELNSNGKPENIKEEPIEEVQIPEEQLEEVPEEVVVENPPPAKPVKVVSKPKQISVSPKPKQRRKETSSSSSSIAEIDRSLPFHIIAGSFGSKANAQRLANKLAANGFSNSSIEDKAGSYRVSAKGFASKDAAISELASVQAIASGAWVYEVK